MLPSSSSTWPGLRARRRSIVASLAAGAVIASLVAGATGAATTLHLTAVAAQPRIAGTTSGNNLSPELIETPVARGSTPLENTSADGVVAYYGYLNDGDPLMPINFASPKEAQKTEPDKITYLVQRSQHGADPAYDYGTHFLYSGHELGPRGYITRVNLDADPAHRVTLLASEQVATDNLPAGHLPVIDGSVWNPFTKSLLFSFEGNGATTGGIWEATPDYPSTVVDRLGLFGRGGFEGMQEDNDGNIWIVEDIGGKAGTSSGATNGAKQPNSFVFRFVPYTKHDLDGGGRLQVLQVKDKNGVPSTFTGGASPTQADADGDITSQFMKDLHTYGNAFQTRWITVHDTKVDGTATFNANVLAKTKGGTPFKRPENGQFRPAFGFTEFVFTETGDTTATSGANGPSGSSFGGWGGLFRLSQVDPSANTGVLRPFFLGDLDHTALDNITFLDRNNVIAVEDAGDGVHTARNGLDSAFVFHYGPNGRSTAPLRFLGQGRDPSATLDAANAGFGKNETDNEITGIHLSDGNATVNGLIGTNNPLFRFPETRGADRWRLFWNAQHGDNIAWEILVNPH